MATQCKQIESYHTRDFTNSDVAYESNEEKKDESEKCLRKNDFNKSYHEPVEPEKKKALLVLLSQLGQTKNEFAKNQNISDCRLGKKLGHDSFNKLHEDDNKEVEKWHTESDINRKKQDCNKRFSSDISLKSNVKNGKVQNVDKENKNKRIYSNITATELSFNKKFNKENENLLKRRAKEVNVGSVKRDNEKYNEAKKTCCVKNDSDLTKGNNTQSIQSDSSKKDAKVLEKQSSSQQSDEIPLDTRKNKTDEQNRSVQAQSDKSTTQVESYLTQAEVTSEETSDESLKLNGEDVKNNINVKEEVAVVSEKLQSSGKKNHKQQNCAILWSTQYEAIKANKVWCEGTGGILGKRCLI